MREETARELADLQAKITDRIAAAERDDVRAYNAAQSAGWTVDELRKIGLPEPEKKARVKRRAARRPAPSSTTSQSVEDRSDEVAPVG